ncbi:MAG: phosphoenolpyruvate--protein phosphotransferase [Lachnospiraceae bacterium]
MQKLNGKKVFDGVALGRISYYGKEEQTVKRVRIEDAESEKQRFKLAHAQTLTQLKALYEKAVKEVGEADAAIFDIHQMMLQDPDFTDAIHNMIVSQNVNAEYAVATIGDNFSNMFAAMDDDYMKARAADVKDISERLIQVLSGKTNTKMDSAEPVIIVAEDLAPSETVQLDKSKVLGFVTRLGSTNSHTAILARTMNIPALIGVDIDKSWDGMLAAVDATNACIYLEPTEEIISEIKERKAKQEALRQLLAELKGKENITLDGRKVNLYANIGNIGDAGSALQNDAGGIGLFRSEFLYLEKDHYPTEEEQFVAYKAVAETMAGKKVIIRTLDIGADKQVDYFNLEKEANPAMGYRAIRICLDRTEIFKTQLRALFRASTYGNIAIMYPMITSVKEVLQIKEIVQEVKSELMEQGIKFNEVEQGIMIETPAAAMISEMLAKEVDFFSIGTNDLTQYTLAIDRQNPKLDAFYDSHHEAVLRLIELTTKNAHKENIWCGICGELASDTTLTERFLRMGVDELSVSPTFIFKVRKAIRECDLSIQ